MREIFGLYISLNVTEDLTASLEVLISQSNQLTALSTLDKKMLAHLDVEIVEVLDGTTQLSEALDLARLVPLVEDLENLLDELKCGFDTVKFCHVP